MTLYENFSKNSDNWDEGAFSEFPYPLAYSYKRLRNLLVTGDLIEALSVLKDVFEVTIRHIVLYSAAIELNDGSEEIVKSMCKPHKSLSFGDWVNDLTKVAKVQPCISNGSNPDLLTLLVKASRFYNEKQIVKWRNDGLAHNITPDTSNLNFVQELQQKILELKGFFMKNHGQLKALQLYQNGKALVGENCEVDKSQIFIRKDKKLVTAAPVIVSDKKRIAYFESIDPRNVCRFIDYISEGRYIVSSDYFRNIRKKYYSTLSVTDISEVDTKVYLSSVDKALESFGKVEEYVKATYYLEWLERVMQTHGKGIYLMCAEQGTGKTAFAYAIDELGGSNMHIEGCTIRSYYINRTNIRDVMDFSTSVSRMFAKLKMDTLESSSDQQLPRIAMNSSEPALEMANLLNKFRKYHDQMFFNDHLLLVIDGIDELRAANANILNFIPHTSMLDDGVHILLTCRSNGAIPAYVLPFVQTFSFSETKIFNKSTENRELLLKYIKTKIKIKERKLNEEETKQLIGVLQDNFSNAQLIKQFLEYGTYEVDKFNELMHEQILNFYFDYLRRIYGEKLFKKILRLYCVIATLYEPVDIQELVWLVNGIDHSSHITMSDMAMLYDLKSLITVERSYRGNLYYVKNQQYTVYVVENYLKEIQGQIREWITYLQQADLNQTGVSDQISYLLAYLYQYCKEYGDIGLIDGEIVEKMNNYAVYLAKVSNYEHSIARVINIYSSVALFYKYKYEHDEHDKHDIKNINGYVVACRNIIHSYAKIKQFHLRMYRNLCKWLNLP